MSADFSKRFRVVTCENVQLSRVEQKIVEAMGDTALSIREISAAAKVSVMAVCKATESLMEKTVIHELEPAEVKAA